MKSFLVKSGVKISFYYQVIKYMSDEDIKNLNLPDNVIIIHPICLDRNDLSKFKNIFIKACGNVRIKKNHKNKIYLYFDNSHSYSIDFETLRYVKCNIFKYSIYSNLAQKYPILYKDNIKIKIVFHEHEFRRLKWNEITNKNISFLKIEDEYMYANILINKNTPKIILILNYIMIHHPLLLYTFSIALCYIVSFLTKFFLTYI
jgi:hypothetical protein